jgi:hypothetical protein
MAALGAESESTDVTPTEVDTGDVAPAAVATDPTPAAPDSFPTHPVAPGHQVVYVEAPKPFIAKGNRGFGILIALLSTVIFAAAFALAGAIANLVNGQPADFAVVETAGFWAPVVLFAIGFLIVVIVVNRAGWAAHVLGSIFVGLVVFFGGTGAVLLLEITQIPSNRVGEHFTATLFSIPIILAAILGREVALWMGFAVAARGRKVKARNVEARVLYDQEIASKRAEYEQANARNAAAVPVAQEPVFGEPVVEQTAAP